MELRNVIWISSYPKSGNTWVNNVVKLAGKSCGFPQATLDVYSMLDSNKLPPVCPAVKAEYAENPCVVLKTHAMYQPGRQLHRFPGMELHNAGFIHISRNPLDVLLSYISFTRIQYRNRANSGRRDGVRKYQKQLFRDLLGFDRVFTPDEWAAFSLETIPRTNLDHALDSFSDNGLCIPSMKSMCGSWVEHIQSWTRARDDMKGVSIRYEDCLADRSVFLATREFFKFGKRDVKRALRVFEKKVDSRISAGSLFYNKRQAYYFVDYFSAQAISRFFGSHEQTLTENGYASLLEMN
jgi:hypothetical protein